MNYRGSYRHLAKNAKSALLFAIEIYNKPQIEYREESFVILLLNAWELVLKAVLSKNKINIFYKKKRNEPYRTLSWKDAILKAEKYFPSAVDGLAVRRNLDLLSTYRDNAVHFYNQKDFFVVIYALAQTSVINFRDVLQGVYGHDLADDITWQLLPLGMHPPVDPIAYIAKETENASGNKSAVSQFLALLRDATKDVSRAKGNTGRLLTTFSIKLESTKKIKNADFVVGVGAKEATTGPLTIFKTADPNVTHPLRRTDVLQKAKTVAGIKMTSYVLAALVWKYEVKAKANFCWQASEGVLTRYSHDFVTWLRQLSANEINSSVAAYKRQLSQKRKKKK